MISILLLNALDAGRRITSYFRGEDSVTTTHTDPTPRRTHLYPAAEPDLDSDRYRTPTSPIEANGDARTTPLAPPLEIDDELISEFSPEEILEMRRKREEIERGIDDGKRFPTITELGYKIQALEIEDAYRRRENGDWGEISISAYEMGVLRSLRMNDPESTDSVGNTGNLKNDLVAYTDKMRGGKKDALSLVFVETDGSERQAKAIQASRLRRSHSVYQTDPNRFAVLLPDDHPEGIDAAVFATRLLNNLRHYTDRTDSAHPVSIGTATIKADRRADPNTLLAKAQDDLLFGEYGKLERVAREKEPKLQAA